MPYINNHKNKRKDRYINHVYDDSEESIDAVVLKLGDIFQIRLDENPSTGYKWFVDVSDGLTILDNQYKSANNLIGGGGYRTWTLVSTKIGPQHFYGIYARPWERNNNNNKTYKLDIINT